MSEAEQLRQKLLNRSKERKSNFEDWDFLYKYLEAVARETLNEKAKQEKAQAAK